MANMKRISAAEARKATEQMKAKKKVKITGSASSTPQVSNSMIKSQPKTTTKPKASGMSRMLPRSPSKANKTPMPKIVGAKPGEKKLLPKVTNKPKERMTKQDAAMKKLLERKYGKIYG
jgi:hypothetical protein